MKNETEAYKAGKQAFQLNEQTQVDANPYKVGTQNALDFQAGFYDSEDAEEKRSLANDFTW